MERRLGGEKAPIITLDFLVTAFTRSPCTCRGLRALGELSSCRTVRGDLPGTLLFAFRLLRLEPVQET